MYFLTDYLHSAIIMTWGFFGWKVPAFHRDPIKSRTVSEFWARRWNIAMAAWLLRNCYVPLARRRRRTLGVLAAFAYSTVMHAWFVLVALGPTMAAILA